MDAITYVTKLLKRLHRGSLLLYEYIGHGVDWSLDKAGI